MAPPPGHRGAGRRCTGPAGDGCRRFRRRLIKDAPFAWPLVRRPAVARLLHGNVASHFQAGKEDNPLGAAHPVKDGRGQLPSRGRQHQLSQPGRHGRLRAGGARSPRRHGLLQSTCRRHNGATQARYVHRPQLGEAVAPHRIEHVQQNPLQPERIEGQRRHLIRRRVPAGRQRFDCGTQHVGFGQSRTRRHRVPTAAKCRSTTGIGFMFSR